MKINKLVVHLFLYFLTIKSFSQTPQTSMTIPDFSYRPSIIDGIYKGILMQDGAYEPFHMTLDLRVTSAEVTGTTSFSVGEINATFQIKGTYLRVKQWSGEKNPNPEDLAFIANDIAVKKQNGVSILCKKEYKAKIEITSDSVIFYGTWKNEGRAMFENYTLVLNSTNDCYPGTFRVAKAKNQNSTRNTSNNQNEDTRTYTESKTSVGCISGNCQNGFGVQELSDGRYEGEFRNGKREGKGTFIYSDNNFYKGYMYIGEFANNAFNGFGTQYKIINNEKVSDYKYHNLDIYTKKSPNGDVLYKSYEGNWVDNYPYGLGCMYQEGLPHLGYWLGWYIDDHKGITLQQITNHLDTTFSNFKKCDCLTPAKISIDAFGLGTVDYDVIDVSSGKKVDETSELSTVDKSFSSNGFVNKTNHKVFIKCYRKVHYASRNVDEYIDESYVVNVGEKIFGNYRMEPEAGTLYALWSQNIFIFLGQYCLKNETSLCKPAAK